MKGSRLLIVLLLLATVLVDCAVLVASREMQVPHPAVIAAWALQMSQVSLTAIWLGIGAKPLPLRLVGVVLVVALWSWISSSLPQAPDVRQWTVLLMAQTVAIPVPLLIARSMGLGLVDISATDRAADATIGPQRLQFSIAYLLGCTAALAVMLSILKYIAPDGSLPLGFLLATLVVVFLIGRALMALAALWTVLGTRWLPVRIITLAVTGLTAFGALRMAQPAFAGGFPYCEMLFCLEGLLLVGSLWVFRAAGYRLRVRRIVGDDQNADDVCQGR